MQCPCEEKPWSALHLKKKRSTMLNVDRHHEEEDFGCWILTVDPAINEERSFGCTLVKKNVGHSMQMKTSIWKILPRWAQSAKDRIVCKTLEKKHRRLLQELLLASSSWFGCSSSIDSSGRSHKPCQFQLDVPWEHLDIVPKDSTGFGWLHSSRKSPSRFVDSNGNTIGKHIGMFQCQRIEFFYQNDIVWDADLTSMFLMWHWVVVSSLVVFVSGLCVMVRSRCLFVRLFVEQNRRTRWWNVSPLTGSVAGLTCRQMLHQPS